MREIKGPKTRATMPPFDLMHIGDQKNFRISAFGSIDNNLDVVYGTNPMGENTMISMTSVDIGVSLN
jgi:hypothetical protein